MITWMYIMAVYPQTEQLTKQDFKIIWFIHSKQYNNIAKRKFDLFEGKYYFITFVN